MQVPDAPSQPSLSLCCQKTDVTRSHQVYMTSVHLPAHYPAISKPCLVRAYGDALPVAQEFHSSRSSLFFLRAGENWLGI